MATMSEFQKQLKIMPGKRKDHDNMGLDIKIKSKSGLQADI